MMSRLRDERIGLIVTFENDITKVVFKAKKVKAEIPPVKQNFVCIHPQRPEMHFMIHKNRYGTEWKDDIKETKVKFQTFKFSSIWELGKHFGEHHEAELTDDELKVFETGDYISLVKMVQERVTKDGEFGYILWE